MGNVTIVHRIVWERSLSVGKLLASSRTRVCGEWTAGGAL
jgi:hypothetical protein